VLTTLLDAAEAALPTKLKGDELLKRDQGSRADRGGHPPSQKAQATRSPALQGKSTGDPACEFRKRSPALHKPRQV